MPRGVPCRATSKIPFARSLRTSGARTKAGELAMPRKASPAGRRRTCTGSRDRAAWPDRARSLEQSRESSAARPGGSARAPQSGWLGARRGCRRTRLKNGIHGRRHRHGPHPAMVVVRPVPHIVSAASGMMVPSWLRGPRCAPTRVGARRSCSRMSRSTRRLDVRRPATRSRAQNFAPLREGSVEDDGSPRAGGSEPEPNRPDAAAVRAERRKDGGRRWRVRRARPGTRGPGHKACHLRARGSGSSLRPPAGQRAVGLQGSDLGVQQETIRNFVCRRA